MRDFINLVEDAHKDPVRASLERYFNDPNSIPDRHSRAEGRYVFPDGSAWAICTNWMRYVRRLLGHRAIFYGFDASNKDSEIAQFCFGHDFAVVDGRYIVDGWLTHVAGMHGSAVLDLDDPADAETITRLYGPKERWKRDKFGHEPEIDAEDKKARARAMKKVAQFDQHAAEPMRESFKLVETATFTPEQIDAAIKAVARKHHGFGGNCALFAVVLNRVLGGGGTYLCADSGESYEYVDHVALEIGGNIYDGSGLITREQFEAYAEDDEDEPGEVFEVETDEDALRLVDGTGGGMAPTLNAEALTRDLGSALEQVRS